MQPDPSTYEAHLLNLFQSLFAKQQLRKNVYIFKHLNPDMTIKFRVIANQRHVATITKDPTIIQKSLSQCPLIELDSKLGQIKILMVGDPLVVTISAKSNSIQIEQIRKKLNPLVKNIKHQFRYPQQKSKKNVTIRIQFQSEAAVTEVIARLQAKKQLSTTLNYQVTEKDPYQCLKQSIRLLKKERRNQQQQISGYSGINNPNNYYNYYQSGYKVPNPGDYQPFIRKAVESSDEEQGVQLGDTRGKRQQEQKGKNGVEAKINDLDEFPTL